MSGDTARRAYGLCLQRLTGQTECAYCEVSLVDDYYCWLLLSVDHVIPVAECNRLGIPFEWAQSYSNTVLSCFGCNGFDNHYTIQRDEATGRWSLDRFFALRDRVFEDRKDRIARRRADEIGFYESRPWEQA